jgi:hypothetical protein
MRSDKVVAGAGLFMTALGIAMLYIGFMVIT